MKMVGCFPEIVTIPPRKCNSRACRHTVELSGSNTDGSFTASVSNPFLSP